MYEWLSICTNLSERLDEPSAIPWAKGLFGREAGITRLDALVPLFLHIRDRWGRLVRLRPNPAQQLFVQRRTRRNIILKARQLGMTTYIAARFFLATILRPGTVTMQVAHSLESAQQIFRIVHRFAQHLPPGIAAWLVTARANVRELAFAVMDSRYIVDTAGNPNAGRGLTVQNLHASEVALWPGHPQETMAGLLAAVAPGGCVEIESTPHGVGGHFHREWLRAQDGNTAATFCAAGFTPHFFPWWIEPAYRLPVAPDESLGPLSSDEKRLTEREGLDLEQLKYRRYLRATFGELAPQEFAENDAECFLVSGRPVFDVVAIDARLRESAPPLYTAQNGAEMMWFEPVRGRSYVIGADVAEGGEEGDFSAAVVLDTQTGLQCAELLARWPIHRFAQELARIGQHYNAALIAVERNNHGHAVLYALRHQLNYPNIYRHPAGTGSPGDGWPMNAQTKPQAIGALAKMLRDAPQVFQSRRLLEQCRAFAYSDIGDMSALPGLHDDLVIAMAIALAVRAQAGNVQLASVLL